jgi:uncharacterized membrane protein YfcA
MVLVPLGIAAGMLTTLTGAGGGMFLLVVMALVWDPLTALTVSALALLVGNSHRLWLFRQEVSRKVLIPMLCGGIPGSLLGSTLAVALPAAALHGIMLAMAALSLAHLATAACAGACPPAP